MEKIRFTDTTLRDAHQSLWATRMRLEDMVPVLEHIDNVGYWSLEVWGGATFDVCLRFLNEDPWERLSEIRKHVKKTKLQMLLRGQNIVGYHNYPDDLLGEFVKYAAERGLDIFRVFDALNDARNLEKAVEFVKREGKHAQGTLCYAISPVHTIEYYLKRAKEQKDTGVDSICIKDMAGILAPQTAYDLVAGLKSEVGLPVQLHCHATSGMAVATYLKAAEAGVDIIDTASAPLAFSTSQPAAETMAACFANTQYDPELQVQEMEKVEKHFKKVAEGRRIKGNKMVDAMVIIHQIPGGMASNLLSQLKEQKAEDRLDDVLREVPKVREDLGYPPLVTPTSQIVGVQAVMNVLGGERYKLVPKEVKDYIRGLYGRSPAPVKESVIKRILGNEKPLRGRPADRLEPALPEVHKKLSKEFVQKEEDYISYALFPEVSLRFFKWRKNPRAAELSKPEPEKKPGPKRTKLEPAANEQIGVGTVRELIEMLRTHNVTELEWEHNKDRVRIRREGTKAPPGRDIEVGQTVQMPPLPGNQPEVTEQPAESADKTEEISSPMVGIFYLRPKPDASAFIEKGDIVEPGQTLCIVEAMKLMNEIQAEKKCRIVDIFVEDGESVEYGQPLVLVLPL
ncbi:acetyl-CoA carboxylase, biotin carboxyl carrier protein [candidate division WOR-3 bacterium JGI_Cruoil_03_51_56]|uniref:Acetyl-CoA carboxylase, biotin carboxyl carrier protein n=1 Tax=candidate division WOR-3 bacterium JGI_Cruoil_03_51_56 TaxID=1973747 RepID=A0A235BS05_UNCW3|nr:MAG: acetyl-CoA carboxylase, biotin carboxyl carrier protein [candidate division WOR-3 bacterium JGI_Cruoil_03_51_56]